MKTLVRLNKALWFGTPFLLVACAGCGDAKEDRASSIEEARSGGAANVSGSGSANATGGASNCPEEAAFELPPSPAPWTEERDGISCHHPAVEPDCRDGWCTIPAGCFVMGSPVTEPGRGASTEDEVATTITRAFVIGEHEVTQEMWTSLIEQNPSGGTTIEEVIGEPWEIKSIIGDDYPADNVSWLEAVFFANALSESEGRPACYELVDCTGEVGLQEFRVAGSKTSATFDCADVKLTAETLYECMGYRLPTEAEWEYAARAGTRTAYYSGEVPFELESDIFGCEACAPQVNDIGWHSKTLACNPIRSVRSWPINGGFSIWRVMSRSGYMTSDLLHQDPRHGPIRLVQCMELGRDSIGFGSSKVEYSGLGRPV